MATVLAPTGNLQDRFDRLKGRVASLALEGVPFPFDQIEGTYERAVQLQDLPKAALVLQRAEALCTQTERDWSWVRELLRRADEIRELASNVGVDVQYLDARVGNPRVQLQAAMLSGGALERAAASASLALAVLNDAIPKFCVQEAPKLGADIRRARDRGEDVTDATDHFRRFVRASEQATASEVGREFLDARKAVARIPPAPAIPMLDPEEEAEILDEARQLARRLHRIKRRARDAQSAAKLMSQVRAALSEDRRFGTPEEEIEQLWNEVDRITKERGFVPAELPEEAPEPEPVAPPSAPARSRSSRRQPRA